MNIERANGEPMSLETDENVAEAGKVDRKDSRVMVLKWNPALCLLGAEDGGEGKPSFVGADEGCKAAYIVVAVGHRRRECHMSRSQD